MWFDDGYIQIIGYEIDPDTPLYKQWEIKDKIIKFNEKYRYKNVIKEQQKEILELKEEIINLKKLILKGEKNESN